MAKKKSNTRGFSTTSVQSKKSIIAQEKEVEVIADEISSNVDLVEVVPTESEAVLESQPIAIEDSSTFNFKDFTQKESLASLNAQNQDWIDAKAKTKSILISLELNPKQEEYIIKSLKPFKFPAISKTVGNLQVSHFRLLNAGFSDSMVQQILENCPFDEFNRIVQWICLSFDLSLLPVGWTDKLKPPIAEMPLTRKETKLVEIQSIVAAPEVLIIAKNEVLIDTCNSKIILDNEPEILSDNKSWILQKMNDSDLDESDVISQDEEAVFSQDELIVQLKDTYLAVSKAVVTKNDVSLHTNKLEIARIKKKLSALGVDTRYIQLPKLSNEDKQCLENPKSIEDTVVQSEGNDRSIRENPESDDDLVLTIDQLTCSDTAIIPAKIITIRDFDQISWSGMSTIELLRDYLGRNHRGYKLLFKVEEKQRSGFSCSLKISQTLLSLDQFETCDVLVSSKIDAEQYVATKALYSIAAHTKVLYRMSPMFVDLWNEWKSLDDTKLLGISTQNAKNRFDKFEAICKASQSDYFELDTVDHANFKKSGFIRKNQLKLKSLLSWQNRQNSENFQKYQSAKQALPVFKSYEEIILTVSNNQVLIVSGETGSGKSTQIPQFLLQDAIRQSKPFNLVCTEPRRISAISLASRVSAELGDYPVLGKTSWVGYQVKNDNKISKATCINYCTTGILIRMMESDPNLDSYTHVIVDEVHERTLDSDLLLLLLKRLITKREDLRIVLMSATANAQHFARYFGRIRRDVPCLVIPGKTYPVSVMYLESIVELTGYYMKSDSEYAIGSSENTHRVEKVVVSGSKGRKRTETYVVESKTNVSLDVESVEDMIENMDQKKINYDLIVKLVVYICENSPAESVDEALGSILIFMPGVHEIKKLSQILADEFSNRKKSKEVGNPKIIILPLHGNLSSSEQSKVFNLAPNGSRKIVISTNVAETGITIPDAVYVIDTMRAREISFDPKKGITRLSDVMISKANAKQRSGRAGRVQPGFSYHLVTQEVHSNLLDHRPPEALRLPLEDICLKFRAIVKDKTKLVDLLNLLIDPPPLINITRAVDLLKLIQAFDDDEQITKIGLFLSLLPVDIQVGKMILFGALLSCFDPILTICAIISSGTSPFFNTDSSNTNKNNTFLDPSSDLLTNLNAYNAWQRLHFANQTKAEVKLYCKSNNLSITNLESIHDFRMQLLQSLLITDMFKHISYRHSHSPRPLEFGDGLDRNSKDQIIVSSAIGCGLYPNVLLQTAGIKTNPGPIVIPSHPKTSVKIHGSSCYASTHDSSHPKSLAYYSIQMSGRVGGEKAVVWDATVVPLTAYLVLAAKDVQFKALSGRVGLDGQFLTFACNIRSASVLLKLRDELSGAVDRLFVGDYATFGSRLDIFTRSLRL